MNKRVCFIAVLVLLAGFASQGGRATVTYQPTPLEGQGCPSDVDKAQVIENFHSLIEDRVETEITPDTRLLAELNAAVEAVSQNLSELSSNVTQQNADLESTTLQVVDVNTGLTRVIPARSCRLIFENRPELPSGNYWIRISNGSAIQVYCDMARQCCDGTIAGWTRVANLNMTDTNQQCPEAWTLITSPRRTCGRTGRNVDTCDSATFPTHGITYSRVCGRVRAYQVGRPDAFWGFNQEGQTTVDSDYITGVSITHGSSPREHVWSFAAAAYEQWSFSNPVICPCTNINNPFVADFEIPPFVGDNYFCETGTDTSPSTGIQFFPDDPLWDGEGCGPTSTCCELNNPPWFCSQLPAVTSDDIEVRLCFDSSINDENLAVEQLDLYIS